MADRTASLVFGGRYDRVAEVEEIAAERGIAVRLDVRASPKEAFAALRASNEAVGGEMSVSFYMTQRSRLQDASDLVALPVWISRAFRHSNIFVRDDSDLHSPVDLRGRTIGLPEYGMTMAVWLRGLFADEYDVQPRDIRWVSHRAPAGLEPDAVTYPEDVEVTTAPPGASLPEQLLTGEIDAWIGAGVAPPPRGIRRLFADPFAEERSYHARTGIFPIMHVLVLKREAWEADPSLPAALYDVFDTAKRRAQQRLMSTSVPYVTLPWTLAAAEAQSGAAGKDPWPYGVEPNLPTLDTLHRYLREQGLLWADLPLSAYFPPYER